MFRNLIPCLRTDINVVAPESFAPKCIVGYRFRFATLEACLPRALRVDFGRCAIVRLLLARAAAFLILVLAADFCFSVVMANRLPFGWCHYKVLKSHILINPVGTVDALQQFAQEMRRMIFPIS